MFNAFFHDTGALPVKRVRLESQPVMAVIIPHPDLTVYLYSYLAKHAMLSASSLPSQHSLNQVVAGVIQRVDTFATG